jgi:hypothetical protein
MEPISSHPLYKAHTIDSAMNSLWEFYTKKFITLFLVSFVMGLILQYLSSMIRIDFSDYKTFNIDEMMLKLRAHAHSFINKSAFHNNPALLRGF